jgi:hypothetical protein
MLIGCFIPSPDKIGRFNAIPVNKNELGFIDIYYDAYKEQYLNPEAKAYVLHFSNKSSIRLENLRIVFDNNYSAYLSQLLYCYDDGCRDYKNNNLLPNSELSFIFSHDVPNYGSFRDDNNKPFPLVRLISKIKLESKQGIGEWVFEFKEKE